MKSLNVEQKLIDFIGALKGNNRSLTKDNRYLMYIICHYFV